MNHKTIDLLRTSENPHLYLIHIGLSKEEYKETSTLTLPEKVDLVKKIIAKAQPEELLKIINDLIRLELALDSTNPLRSGNRLLGQLIRIYIEQTEQDNFRAFYSPDKSSFDDYAIPQVVKQLWQLIKKAAQDLIKSPSDLETLNATALKIMPIFYYQQVLPQPTDQEILAGVRPIELTRNLALVENFNANLANAVEGPVLPSEKNTMELLTQIKSHIKNTDWKVGNYLLFKGGLMHENQRVPHRIKDVLNLIEQVELGTVEAKVAYAAIIAKAKDAIDQPRTGRASSTTAFYQDLFNHDVLQDDYPFKAQEQVPLLSQ